MDTQEEQQLGRLSRKQAKAREIASRTYPFHGCVICGIELDAILHTAHLNNDPGDNDPDNLAWLCPTHHWMTDHGLYPVTAIKMLRAHWQLTMGQPDHTAVMKQAGPKSAAKRRSNAEERRARAGNSPFGQQSMF
jgi:hypothetical protein